MSGGGNDPFSNTNSRNVLKHLISPKVVSQLAGGYVVKTDLINVDNLYLTGGIYGPTGAVYSATGATGPSGPSGPSGTLSAPNSYFFNSVTSAPSANLKIAGGGVTSVYTSNIPLTAGKWYLVSGTLSITVGTPFVTSSVLTMFVTDNGTGGGNTVPIQPILATPTTSTSSFYIPISGVFKASSDATFLVITFASSVAEAAYSNAGTTAILTNVETIVLS
jgi:hypothetical protein